MSKFLFNYHVSPKTWVSLVVYQLLVCHRYKVMQHSSHHCENETRCPRTAIRPSHAGIRKLGVFPLSATHLLCKFGQNTSTSPLLPFTFFSLLFT